MKIPDMDHKKFDQLMDFANQNNYQPFGSKKKSKTTRIPYPDKNKVLELMFYKESKDKLFTSPQDSHFYRIDDKLYLIYVKHGTRNGEHNEVEVIQVPNDIGAYFIKLVHEKNVKIPKPNKVHR